MTDRTRFTILINTHRADCINLLKVRDYLFDKARRLHLAKLCLMVIPAIFAVSAVIPVLNSDLYTMVVGLISICCYFLVVRIQMAIDAWLGASNSFREEYDVRVFEMEPNVFFHDKTNLDEYNHCSRYMPHVSKYEMWYGEVACENHFANVICAQLDNIIYTYFIYRKTKQVWTILLTVLSCLLGAIIVFLILRGQLSNALLFVIAAFGAFQVLLDERSTMSSLIDDNKKIMDQADEFPAEKANNELFVRTLQDAAIENRRRSLFVPLKIRDEYLKDDSEYYKRLDNFREKFMGPYDARTIKDASEIPVVRLTDDHPIHCSQDVPLVDLRDIHRHLATMMTTVKTVWEDNGIGYTLDAGTLLGAIREGGQFLFWDDDVDVILPFSQLEKAKTVIREELGDLYEIQDCSTDPYYSPRLSNFRIREKNSVSCVSEKDSPLYEKYAFRGLFIDVYAYSPIWRSIRLDRWYKTVWFSRLNTKTLRVENQMMYRESQEKRSRAETKFHAAKKRYLIRLDRYIRRARNSQYVSYTPNYIADPWKAGPYIAGDALLSERRTHLWSGEQFFVPHDPQAVLEAEYGPTWHQSPYVSSDALKKKWKASWYSENVFAVSVLKHLIQVDLK